MNECIDYSRTYIGEIWNSLGERKKLCSVIAIMVVKLIMKAALPFTKRFSWMMRNLTIAITAKMMNV